MGLVPDPVQSWIGAAEGSGTRRLAQAWSGRARIKEKEGQLGWTAAGKGENKKDLGAEKGEEEEMCQTFMVWFGLFFLISFLRLINSDVNLCNESV